MVQGDLQGMVQALDEWQRAQPQDIEIPIAFGEMEQYQALGQGILVPDYLPKTAEEDFAQLPSQRGRDIDPVLNERQQGLLLRALEVWKQLSRTHPERLDLVWGIAKMDQELGDFESQYWVLARYLQYADHRSSEVRWTQGRPLPETTRKVVPCLIWVFIHHYLSSGSNPDLQHAIRLCHLTSTFYPHSGGTRNALAACRYLQADFPASIRNLLLALQDDPQDCVAMGNLAELLEKTGHPKGEKFFDKKILKLHSDPVRIREAQARLKSLEEGH